MTKEEPSLKTLWLQNIQTMDKVQRTDHSNTAASSETFRDDFLMAYPKVKFISNGTKASPCPK
jgi:hypothetical protein